MFFRFVNLINFAGSIKRKKEFFIFKKEQSNFSV